MIELLRHPDAFPFTVALTIMAGLAVLEAVSLLFGAGLSGFLDDLLPDSLDGPDVDLDLQDTGFVAKAFGWLKINEVPALVALILFLLCFGLTGLAFQGAAVNWQGEPLSAGAAVVAALLACLPLLRLAVATVKPIIPRDETDVVSQESFVGMVATVVLGNAEQGSPAQAKLFDEHGQAHYIMVEPEQSGARLDEGTNIRLTGRRGIHYEAQPSISPLPSPDESPTD